MTTTSIRSNPFTASTLATETLRRLICGRSTPRKVRLAAIHELECRADEAGYKRAVAHARPQRYMDGSLSTLC